MTDQGRDRPGDDHPQRHRASWAKALFELTPWGLRRRLTLQSEVIDLLAGQLDAIQSAEEGRLVRIERRLDAVEETVRAIQDELEAARDRIHPIEQRLDRAETAHGRMQDEVLPAVVERGNVLIDRLAEEIEEVASLVERMMLAEPLPTPGTGTEAGLPQALAEVQPRLLEAFRGSEEEIRHRLDHHLPVLREAKPVLDLGCGRGELLLLLRDAGITASGVESDPALAQAARRRGLDVVEDDVLEALRAQPEGSLGAVTAIHLLEHLEQGRVLEVLREARRALRPGGVFLAECPNPLSLRVGAALFWLDPTHVRPLLPEVLELYLESIGFEVKNVEFLHPFPQEQSFAVGEGDVADNLSSEAAGAHRRLAELESRLDDLINGPRDFAIVAATPSN
jgi:O-antigen chain-terminating methyltransferase